MNLDKKFRDMYFYTLNINNGFYYYEEALNEIVQYLEDNIKHLTVQDIFKLLRLKEEIIDINYKKRINNIISSFYISDLKQIKYPNQKNN